MPLWTPTGGWCITPSGNSQGIAAMVLTYGAPTFQRWLGGVLTTLLGPNTETAQRVQRAMNVATNANVENFSDEIPEFSELIDALVVPMSLLFQEMNVYVSLSAQAMRRITTTRLPLVQLQAAQEANDAQYNAETLARELTGAESYYRIVGDQAVTANARRYAANAQYNAETLARELTGAESYYRIVGDQAVTATSARRAQIAADYADTVATDVLTYAEQETAALRADLQATTSWADAQITATRHQAATDAANAANTAIADQNRTVSITLAPIWAGTAESLNKVGQEVKQLAPSVTPAVTAISSVTPVDLQVALQALTNGLRTTATAVDQCALPNCREKNTYGRTAHDVGTLMGMGAILALLAGAARDPSGTAHELTSLFGTLARDTAKGIDDLVKAF